LLQYSQGTKIYIRTV